MNDIRYLLLTIANIDNILKIEITIIDKGGDDMAREKFQTLTEQMFYILLCLRQECCGTDIMAQIQAVTGGRVSVGPGTLYNLLESFLTAGMIRETKVEGRKRSYMLTGVGRQTLEDEVTRMNVLIRDYGKLME